MNLPFPSRGRSVFALILLLASVVDLSAASTGTSFTYQGRLMAGANGANGSYDLRFALFNADTNGVQTAGPVTNVAVAVSNGLFAATLDFGAAACTGADRWLEVGVRPNGGGAFTTLAPRQPLTPIPYAITASNLSGSCRRAN